MDILEFVTSVLVDLDNAIESTGRHTKRRVYFTNPKDSRTVEFDIAVSVEKSADKSGKAGVKVLGIAQGDGQLKLSDKSSTISRVRFGVNIDPNTREENEAESREIEVYNNNRPNIFDPSRDF